MQEPQSSDAESGDQYSSDDTQPVDTTFHRMKRLRRSTVSAIKRVFTSPKSADLERVDTMFFRDGTSHIDYVLASHVAESEEDLTKQAMRSRYESSLVDEGLTLEYEDKTEARDGLTTFVKIHATWEVLTRYAEMMKMKMPLKVGILEEEAGLCTAVFSRDHTDKFLIPEDKSKFFKTSQRSRIVYEILTRAHFNENTEEDPCAFGIKRMLKNDAYTAAFPLHEDDYRISEPKSDRHVLYADWAKPSNYRNYQPLGLIRDYFGEKIGIYFSWLGYYTYALIPASIVGLVVFLYGIGSLLMNPIVNEICDPDNKNYAGNVVMCPQCDIRCEYWHLKDNCMYSRFTYLFDNYATCVFATFMCLWATIFIEFWKRKQVTLNYRWDVANYEEEEENPRPEFEAVVRHKRKNLITQKSEPFLPTREKIPKLVSSFFVIFFMIALVFAAIFGVIVYRMVIVVLLYSTKVKLVVTSAALLNSVTAAMVSLIIITVLNLFYDNVARWLTNFETHRTETEWEDNFTLKMFLFQAVNYYGIIFYIAFFKGRFNGRPGKYVRIFGYRQEECNPAGCLMDLCIQLGIVMTGKQVINNCQELLIPWIRTKMHLRREKKVGVQVTTYTRWEQDFDLTEQPEYGLFEEYLEMVIQFGFVTIFVAAFPLAPLFALLNNVIEIRLDAYKFVCVWRRPVAARAQDIGVWFHIIETIARVATLTNAFIIAFASDFVQKVVYTTLISEDRTLAGYVSWTLSTFNTSDFEEASIPPGEQQPVCRYRDFRQDQTGNYKFSLDYWHVFAARLAFVLCFEHLVLTLTWIVAYMVPDVPAEVKLLKMREAYLTKTALYNAELTKARESRVSDEMRSLTMRMMDKNANQMKVALEYLNSPTQSPTQ